MSPSPAAPSSLGRQLASATNLKAVGVPPAALDAGPPSSRAPVSAPPSSRGASVVERAHTIGQEDFFRRLSVARDASAQQVHDAFRMLERVWAGTAVTDEDPRLRDAHATVLAALVEARDTLVDPTRRTDYLRKLLLGVSHQPTVADDLAASGQSNESDGAAASFATGDLDRAERLARRANRANPRDPQALMLLAWLESRHASNQGPEPTKLRIRMLTAVIQMEPDLIDAYFYRAMLLKRCGNTRAAIADLRRVLSLSPDRRDAQDELRDCEGQGQEQSGGLLNRLWRS